MVSKEYRDRLMGVYANSPEEKKKYEEMAEKAGEPLSKFLLNLIEEATAEEKRPSKSKASEELHQEIRKLQEDLRVKNRLIDNYQQDLHRLRNAAWLDSRHDGTRQFDAELLQVLRSGYMHDYELLEALRIDLKDVEAVRVITNQLVALEEMGFIKKNSKGWRWVR